MSSELKKRFEQIFDYNYRRMLIHALRSVQYENYAQDFVAEVLVQSGNDESISSFPLL